jgi:hypothetical protein
VPTLLTRLRLFVLLGALLLFGMEPLVGRLLLPACGGGFHVWAACLMFFQGALFLGYLYCHLEGGRLGRGHLLLALLPLAFLPIGQGLQALEPNPGAPTASIAWALTVGIAVPFVILSTTGVMAQRWLAESDLPERENPYQLYAASNIGSFVALLAYPLLVEPLLGLQAQRWVWSAAFLVYVGIAASVTPTKQRGAAAAPAPEPVPEPVPKAEGAPAPEATAHAPAADAPTPAAAAPAPEPQAAAPAPDAATPESEVTPTPTLVVAWLLLSAAPSAVLMAVTNVIAMDLGSLPLVWVVPLSLYLLSFVPTFGPQELYPRAVRLAFPLVIVCGLLVWLNGAAFTWIAGLAHLGVLVVCCWVGHAELYRSRPAPRHLTAFYLCVSLGGWLGGIFVAIVAPYVFNSLAEYPLGLAALALAVGFVRRADVVAALGPGQDSLTRVVVVLTTVCVVVGLGSLGYKAVINRGHRPPEVVRNEYGIYRIGEAPALTPNGEILRDTAGKAVRIRAITHGTIVHGKELLDPRGHGRPIGYFHPTAPLGQALKAFPRPLRLAIVGLGAGALVGNLRAGDEVTYYELDPLVEKLAREHFHYLETPPATVLPIVHGDARLELARADPGRYDVILVDAFSSDAIPVHLLTREALALYLSKLSPRGWLVFHISSRYYDLRPVLRATAASLDPPLTGCLVDKSEGGSLAVLEDPSSAYVLSRDPASLGALLSQGWRSADDVDLATLSPWSDDYANVLGALWARLRARSRTP